MRFTIDSEKQKIIENFLISKGVNLNKEYEKNNSVFAR